MRISDWSSDVCSSDLKVDTFPNLNFPDLQHATLANGSKLILAERHEIPVVQMSYLFDGGYASDQGGKLGRAGFALGMLDEGAGKLGALEFAAAEENLGARLSASASLDGSSASRSAQKENLAESFALFAEMLREIGRAS